ncbi:MAG: rhombosortase [Opitutaceae bacterium]|nr:rhombosortase [Opitutaceae bacterium]
MARSWATLLIAVAAGLAFAWPGLASLLIYERAGLLAGQAWRLWTGHLVHFNSRHLLLDLAVFLPAGVWLELITPRLARGFYLLTPPAVSAALLLFDSTLIRYAGLSGIATGLLVLLALVQLRRKAGEPPWFWLGVLLLVAVKTAVEAVAPGPLFVRFDPGVRAVPLAHVGGIVCALMAFISARPRCARAP